MANNNSVNNSASKVNNSLRANNNSGSAPRANNNSVFNTKPANNSGLNTKANNNSVFNTKPANNSGSNTKANNNSVFNTKPANNSGLNAKANNNSAFNTKPANNSGLNAKANNNSAFNTKPVNNSGLNTKSNNNSAFNNKPANNSGSNAKANNNTALNKAKNNSKPAANVNNSSANNSVFEKLENKNNVAKVNNKKNNVVKTNENAGPTFLERAKNGITSLRENKTVVQVLQLVLIAVVTFLIMFGIRWFLKSQQNNRTEAPFIIRGSNSGKNSIVVSQDPSEDSSITLYRSDGEEGAEFTYTTWLLIQNLEYKAGEWKHVFHKGNKTSYPNRAPGVWLHPNKNSLRIYMNTYDNPLEYIDIDNIPVKKWFHISISLNHKYLDIYFNGQLRKRKELTSLPRQNYGELWCCLFGGFEGYISKLQYHRKALDYTEIESIVKAGPSKDACGDTGEYPPYLDDSWWYDL